MRTCTPADSKFRDVTDPNHPHYKSGVLIYNNGKLEILSKLRGYESSIKISDIDPDKMTLYSLPWEIYNTVWDFKQQQVSEGKKRSRWFLPLRTKKDWKRINLIGELPIGIADNTRCLGHGWWNEDGYSENLVKNLQTIYKDNIDIEPALSMNIDYNSIIQEGIKDGTISKVI